jgi:hypothetical protein
MTHRTRYFLTGASLVMAMGLCTGLVAYYNGALPLRAEAGPAELAYIPSDVSAVAYANVRTVMDSEFRQRVRQLLPTGEAQDELKEELGLDIERDIDTVVAGFSAADPKRPGGVVLVRGRFDADLIETKAVAHGATASEYRGKRMLTSPELPYGSAESEGGTASHSGGVAFLEPGLLALGDSDTLKRAIDTAATHEDVTRNADLMRFISEVETGNSAWVVGRFDAVSETAGMPEQVKAQIGAVQWFIVSATVGNGVSGTLRAETRDEEAAEQLRDLVRGGIAAAKLMSGEDKRIEPLLNSVQLQGTGKTVSLSFTLSPEVLDVINGLAAMNKLSHDGGVRK